MYMDHNLVIVRGWGGGFQVEEGMEGINGDGKIINKKTIKVIKRKYILKVLQD